MNSPKLPKPLRLTKLEKQIERDLELGKYVSRGPAEVRRITKMAREQVRREKAEAKSARVNLRFTKTELSALKDHARELGIPYQTFIYSIVHQYLGGRLVDAGAVKSVAKALREQSRARKSA
jgi:predicted DNA binding CopG/RHH family protein